MAAPNPVRIIPATSGNIVAGGEYVIRDEFTTDRAAGAVNGTAAEPGPGTRTVVDTESKLTIRAARLRVSRSSVRKHSLTQLHLPKILHVMPSPIAAGRPILTSYTVSMWARVATHRRWFGRVLCPLATP